MFEKVNPSHPDKVADRIAGALVDYAYSVQEDPRIAVEVLIGHGECHAIAESSVDIPLKVAEGIVGRIAPGVRVDFKCVPQDGILSDNQKDGFRCGDNGIFLGVPLSLDEQLLSRAAKRLYERFPTDGKHILDASRLIICQSNASAPEIRSALPSLGIPGVDKMDVRINPLGPWFGGIGVDCGATNRKLGSDMAKSATGGGLHGKDLSKADVSVNIHAFLKAQRENRVIRLSCAIGDETVDGLPFSQIVEEAREYIKGIGGFERFAEWGLV